MNINLTAIAETHLLEQGRAQDWDMVIPHAIQEDWVFQLHLNRTIPLVPVVQRRELFDLDAEKLKGLGIGDALASEFQETQ